MIVLGDQVKVFIESEACSRDLVCSLVYFSSCKYDCMILAHGKLHYTWCSPLYMEPAVPISKCRLSSSRSEHLSVLRGVPTSHFNIKV